MDRVIYDGSCFGCGQHNEEGLRMRFEPGTDESWCEYEVPERYQSWQSVVHGGVVALMLDEAVGWAGWHAGHPGVTGRLEVRYRRPLRVGERVRVAARLDRLRRGAVYASATIDRLRDDARIAEASATLMEVTAEITAAED